MARGKGEDSIYQRASDGRWVGAVEVGLCPGGHKRRDGTPCPGGERRRTHVVRRTKAEVLAAIKELRDRVDAGATTNRNRTVAGYLDYWLAEVADVADSSRDEYAKRIARVTERIGKVQLVKLTKADVQRLVGSLSAAYAPKTRQTTMATFRQALEWAVPETIPRNPAANVKGPKQVNARIDDALTADQARAVLAAAEGDRYFALYWLALNYGLRIGELIGLRWSAIDGDTMTVTRSKTDAGVRTLPLIDDARAVLDDHRRRWAVVAIDGRVFTGPEGGNLKPQRVRDWWSELLDEAGVPHLCRNCGTSERCSTSTRRFHVTRHTTATLLLEADVPLEVVSAILGHANIQITADIYAKVRADLKRRGLRRLGLGAAAPDR